MCKFYLKWKCEFAIYLQQNLFVWIFLIWHSELSEVLNNITWFYINIHQSHFLLFTFYFRCPIDPTVHVLSESTHETRFVFQDFEYVTDHNSLYLFCNASFCDSGDYSQSCVRRCSSKRNNLIEATLRSGPFETNEVVDIVRSKYCIL